MENQDWNDEEEELDDDDELILEVMVEFDDMFKIDKTTHFYRAYYITYLFDGEFNEDIGLLNAN